MYPSFFIIGTQKGGTTSLYNYLVQHPCVLSATEKEIHYFSDNYQKGPNWYNQHFPSLLRKLRQMLSCRHYVVTGEATPFYMFHPLAPSRIHEAFPSAKIIMMLRNPVDRAFSHFRYHVKLDAENLSFEEAIEAEPERLEGEIERMASDEGYNGTNYKLYSYLKRGIYVEQVERWFALFPKEQILILKSEDFFSEPERCFATVQKFLGVRSVSLSSYKKFNAGEGDSVSPETRERLQNAAYWERIPQADIVDRAIAREIDRMEKRRGEPYQPRPE